MASIGHNQDVPTGITSHFPIGEEHAAELARTVAESLDDVRGIPALCELLLGIAPQRSFARLGDVSVRRIQKPHLAFDVNEVEDLLTDLFLRYSAVVKALESLYTFTPEFEQAFREYAAGLHQTEPPEGDEAPDEQGGEA